MTTTISRYDDHADWYVEYTREWGSVATGFLPEPLTDLRLLDLGCGWGQLSRTLAGKGARVTGVDVSERLLGRARELEAEQPVGIEYRHGDATRTEWWDGAGFDGAVCNMALMDMDDLAGALSSVATVLKPGGWFVFTLFHPCFPGRADDAGTLSSWPPDGGYATEGWWSTEQTGVRGHVGANHRTLSTYLNAVLGAGLEFVEFAEVGDDLPQLLLVHCRRPGAAGSSIG